MSKNFLIVYFLALMPNIILLISSFTYRSVCKKRNLKTVTNSLVLTIVVFMSSIVAAFALIANISYFPYSLIFGYAYIASAVSLFVLFRERIIYDDSSGKVIAVRIFKKEIFSVAQIVRVYSSDTYLDIYVNENKKENRIRYGNSFLKGEGEFVEFVKKQCFKNKN